MQLFCKKNPRLFVRAVSVFLPFIQSCAAGELNIKRQLSYRDIAQAVIPTIAAFLQKRGHPQDPNEKGTQG